MKNLAGSLRHVFYLCVFLVLGYIIGTATGNFIYFLPWAETAYPDGSVFFWGAKPITLNDLFLLLKISFAPSVLSPGKGGNAWTLGVALAMMMDAIYLGFVIVRRPWRKAA